MPTFKLKADCTFDATDIDDAMTQLGAYFKALSDGSMGPEKPMLTGGILTIGVGNKAEFKEEGPSAVPVVAQIELNEAHQEISRLKDRLAAWEELRRSIAELRETSIHHWPEAGISVPRAISAYCVLLKRDADRLPRLLAEVTAHRDKTCGDYWFWQGDGSDHLNSLTCPILIPARDMRELVALANQVDNQKPSGEDFLMSTTFSTMVQRFLGWKVPADFSPDCYITFDRSYNQSEGGNIVRKIRQPDDPMWPTGTNLLNADQAEAMLRWVISGERGQTYPGEESVMDGAIPKRWQQKSGRPK